MINFSEVVSRVNKSSGVTASRNETNNNNIRRAIDILSDRLGVDIDENYIERMIGYFYINETGLDDKISYHDYAKGFILGNYKEILGGRIVEVLDGNESRFVKL